MLIGTNANNDIFLCTTLAPNCAWRQLPGKLKMIDFNDVELAGAPTYPFTARASLRRW